MPALFVWLWLLGGAGTAILGEVGQAETPWLAAAARVVAGLWLSLMPLVVAVSFAVGNSNPNADNRPTRSGWWVVAVLGGIPLALISIVAYRRAFKGRLHVLVPAALASAGLYVAFPLGFAVAGAPLHGLARLEHQMHALDLLVISVPALIIVSSEVIHLRNALVARTQGIDHGRDVGTSVLP